MGHGYHLALVPDHLHRCMNSKANIFLICCAGKVLPRPRLMLGCVCGPPSVVQQIKGAANVLNLKLSHHDKPEGGSKEIDANNIVKGWRVYASSF